MLFALLLTGVASQFAPIYQQLDQGSPIALEPGQAGGQELAIELSISQQAPAPTPAATTQQTLNGPLDVFSVETVPNPIDSLVTISLDTLTPSTEHPAFNSISIEPSMPAQSAETAKTHNPEAHPEAVTEAVAETAALAHTQPEQISGIEPVASHTHVESHTTAVVHQGVNEPDGQIYDPVQTAELAVVSEPPVYSMRHDELFDMLYDYAKEIDRHYQLQEPATPAVAMEQAVQYQAQPHQDQSQEALYQDTPSAQHPVGAAWTVPLDHLGAQLVTDTHKQTSAAATAASPGSQPIEYYGDAYLTFDWMHDNWSYSISNQSAVAIHSANAAHRLTPAIVEWALRFI